MASDRWFGNNAELSLETSDGTSIAVGALQGVSFVASAEHIALWSMGTNFRVDVRKHQHTVPVEASLAAIDIALIQQWLSGDGETVDGTWEDTTEVRQFTLTGEFAPADGGTSHEGVVTGVYFPEMPIMDAEMGAWVTHDLSGEGASVVFKEKSA